MNDDDDNDDGDNASPLMEARRPRLRSQQLGSSPPTVSLAARQH